MYRVLFALVCLVHASSPAATKSPGHAPSTPDLQPSQGAKPSIRKSAQTEKSPQTALKELPRLVRETRDAILDAARTGDIEELRPPLQWSSPPTILGAPAGTDPIDHLRQASADAEGHQILAIIATLLSGPPAELQVGADLENNTIYVWPAVSEADLNALAPSERVEVFRTAPEETALDIIRTGRWSWYRIAIGADGSWLLFQKGQ